MRDRHSTAYRTMPAVLALTVLAGLAAVCPAQPAATPQTQHEAVSLEPPRYPGDQAEHAGYEAWLARNLQDQQARIERLADPKARVRAYLDLATFALVRGAEPQLSRAWLGLPVDRRSAASVLATGRDAIARADHLRRTLVLPANQDQAFIDQGRRLSVLAAMLSAVLEPTRPEAALEAARQGADLAGGLPVEVVPAWNLLIAASLDRADRRPEALLRLQPLLRQDRDRRAQLAAALLQARMLAAVGNHAAAVALLSENLQAAAAVTQPSGAATTQAFEQAPPHGDDLTPDQVRGTLLRVRADVLADWADELRRSDEPRNRLAADLVLEQADRSRREAAQASPYVLRLLPLLDPLDPRMGQ